MVVKGNRQPLLVESYGVVDVVLWRERTQATKIISCRWGRGEVLPHPGAVSLNVSEEKTSSATWPGENERVMSRKLNVVSRGIWPIVWF